MSSKDLEFISVENDDDEEFGMNQTYGDNSTENSYENALGNAFLKQSKVFRISIADSRIKLRFSTLELYSFM